MNGNGGFFWKLPIKALSKVRNHFPGLQGGIFRTLHQIILVRIELKILGKFWKKFKLGPLPTILFFCSWTLAQDGHFKHHEMCAQKDRNHPLTIQQLQARALVASCFQCALCLSSYRQTF